MSANAVPQPPIGGLGETPCATDLELFLDPLLEEPPSRSAVTKDIWSQYEVLVARAQTACAGCALLADCMYKAVVQSDVSGFVGCTTPQDRVRMRRALGIKVDTDGLDQYARHPGISSTGGARRCAADAGSTPRRAAGVDRRPGSVARCQPSSVICVGRGKDIRATLRPAGRACRVSMTSSTCSTKSSTRPPRDPPADGSFDPRRPKGRGHGARLFGRSEFGGRRSYGSLAAMSEGAVPMTLGCSDAVSLGGAGRTARWRQRPKSGGLSRSVVRTP